MTSETGKGGREAAAATLDEMRTAMGINYFTDQALIGEQSKHYAE